MPEELLVFVIIVGAVGLIAIGIALGVVRTQLWIRRLGSPKRHVREQARSWLYMQGKQPIRLLLRSLQHDNAMIRREVAEVLGVIGDSRAILPLLDALNDKEKTVRWEIITALGRLQAFSTTNRLVNVLDEPDKESRRRSVEALGRIGGTHVLNALERALHDEDSGVRKNAIIAMAAQQRVTLFVDMLQDPNADVRLLAAESLTAHHWQPQNDRERIAYELACRNWSSPLLSTPAAVDPLLIMLQDERPENLHARINAAIALGKIGAPQAFEPLVQMCRHVEANIRATAVTALGDLKDARALTVLVHTIKDTAATVRAASATALGKSDDPRCVEALIQALGDTDPARLGDRNPEVQRAAAAALERMPGQRVTTTLVNALEDDDAVVRYEAAEVLVQRGWTPVQEADTIRYLIAREDWESVKNFGAQALPQLIARSTDKERGIRDFAANLLTTLLSSVKIVVFGDIHITEDRKRITFQNPDVEALNVPMENLEHIVVHVETYEFHRLERFLTYAVNYIGQNYLKHEVVAHVYGDAANLHPNLLNTLKNVCKDIKQRT